MKCIFRYNTVWRLLLAMIVIAGATYFPISLESAFVKSVTDPQDSGFWHTDGATIVDGNGNPVLIRSMGMLGSWWYQGDMQGDIPVWDHDRDSYKELKELGFNAVRLLMSYDSFEKTPYNYEDADWEWLDENIRWAEENGMKIILNMHYTQGGMQYTKSGESLWIDPENQNRLVEMWRVIAARYKDCTTIAGWGLINEPGLVALRTKEETHALFSDLMQRITDAIRESDRNHIIFCERSTGLYTSKFVRAISKLLSPNDTYLYPYVKDDNLAHEFHFYYPQSYTFEHKMKSYPGKYLGKTINRDALKEEMLRIRSLFTQVYQTDQIPIFIGEFGIDFNVHGRKNAEAYAWISDVIDICEELGYGYSYHYYHGTNFGLWDTPSYKDYKKGRPDETLAALFWNKQISHE